MEGGNGRGFCSQSLVVPGFGNQSIEDIYSNYDSNACNPKDQRSTSQVGGNALLSKFRGGLEGVLRCVCEVEAHKV